MTVLLRLCEDLGITKTEKPVKGEIRKSVDSGRTKTSESGGGLDDAKHLTF